MPEQPLDRPTRNALGMELSVAREAALKYPTVADAEAGGLPHGDPYVPLIGAHYLNFGIVDTTFDATKPEMLLYDGTSRTTALSACRISSPRRVGTPAGFVGPDDDWHQHIGLCIKNGVVVGGEKTTPRSARAVGATRSA